MSGKYTADFETLFSREQLAIAQHIYLASMDDTLLSLSFSLGSSSLSASSFLNSEQQLQSGTLPEEQWKMEMKGWHDYTLAYLQRMLMDVAAGPNIRHVQTPVPPEGTNFDVCKAQKIRDPEFYSLSLPGLIVTVVVGGAIVLVNLGLSTVVGCIQRLTGKGLSRMEDWKTDHMLQVQRMAYENAGIGVWSKRDGLVPVTEKGQRFGKPMSMEMMGSPHGTAYMGGSVSIFSPAMGQADPFLQKGDKQIRVDVREGGFSP